MSSSFVHVGVRRVQRVPGRPDGNLKSQVVKPRVGPLDKNFCVTGFVAWQLRGQWCITNPAPLSVTGAELLDLIGRRTRRNITPDDLPAGGRLGCSPKTPKLGTRHGVKLYHTNRVGGRPS